MPAPSVVRSYIGAGTTSSRTISVDTSGGTLLVVKVATAYTDDVDQTPDTATFNGVAMTLHGSVIPGGARPAGYAYYVNAPSGTHDVVISWAAGTRHAVICEVWADSHASSPVGSVQTGTADSGTNATVTCTSGVAGDTITDLVALHKALDSTATVAVGASQTQIQNGTSGAGTLDTVGASSYEAGGTSIVMNWTISVSSRWACLAFAIKQGVVGGASVIEEYGFSPMLAPPRQKTRFY